MRALLLLLFLTAQAGAFQVTSGMTTEQINAEIDTFYAAADVQQETGVPATYPGSVFQFPLTTVYLAQVLRVLDGDTFEAAVVIWPDVVVTKKFRVAGIDTPESRPATKDYLGQQRSEYARQREREAAAEAKAVAEKLLLKGLVMVKHVGQDKYGRELVDVFVTDDRPGHEDDMVSLGAVLIERGLAVPYLGGRKKTWGMD